jgi:hypothetical protein
MFNFSPNAYLADNSLTLKKSFSNIQSPIPGSEVTSTKVTINWKTGKDLTKVVKGAPPSFFNWFAFEGKDQSQEELFDGADIAVSLADEIYPHAHKIYQDSFVEESDEVDEEEDLEESGSPFLFLADLVDEEGSDEEEEEGPPSKRSRKSQ